MSSGDDTERTSVKTYVSTYQKERWIGHAEELGMSQSEFVRTMVQAGRRGFSLDHNETDHEEVDPGGSDPRGDALEDRVLAVLSDEPLGWDELVAELSNDFENRLDETLEELQSSDRIRYSGRNGGYVLTDE